LKKDESIPSFSLCLGLSQPDSQSPALVSTSVPDPSTIGEKDNEDDDDDGDAPMGFPLRNTS